MVPPVERRAGDFLRELAHEVGNALHPLHLIVQILAQPDLDAAVIERLRSGLESQLPSLERMLQDLRRVSLIARDAVEPRRQAIDAATLLRHVAEQFQRRPEAAKVSLAVQIAEGLPRLQADPDLLEKAVEELLANAARHSASGKMIRLTAGAEQGDVVICVTDEGVGISPELLPHVFDLFVRKEEATVPVWGRFGVGLTFVRQVVEKHGGRVMAESPGEGQGAKFTIRLPVSPRT